MTSRTEVEADVATAAHALMRARAEHTDARSALEAATDAYVDRGDKRSLERKRDCEDALERAAALERRAVGAHTVSVAALAAVDREMKVAELEALKEQLGAVDSSIIAHAAELVSIDRAIDGRVLQVALTIRDAASAYDRAMALSADLRVPPGLGARPTLDDACLAVRGVVTAARRADGRDPLAPAWLQEDVRTWHTAGMDAAELHDVERGASAARRAEHRAETFTAGFQAALAAVNTTTNTTTTEDNAS